jgi:hypothetical protein
MTMNRRSSHLGDDDDLDMSIKDDGRSKDDLEVVEVIIDEVPF